MRELGFSKMWDKLDLEVFTTFRFTRRDKDWKVGEIVKVVYRPRSRGRQVLGTAEIVSKEKRRLRMLKAGHSWRSYPLVTKAEARADGFPTLEAMVEWLGHSSGGRASTAPVNKLTLRWLKKAEKIL